MNIPLPVIESILLETDYNTLQNTRELQSEYLRKKTQHNTYKDSIKNNNLINMKWLHDNGRLWEHWTFISAVESGNLEIMKWLHENGCPMHEDTLQYAAKHGNLENMK